MSIKEEAMTLRKNIDAVYNAGKKAEYDNFWDLYQDNGNLINYQSAFSGPGWKDEIFKPKYVPNIKAAALMFRETGIKNIVGLDFSKANDFQYTFYASKVEYIDKISTISASRLYQTFDTCTNLKTIGKLILKADGSQTLTNAFANCPRLKNIEIEGAIGESISFSSCPLTVDSMKSIINHIKNYAGTSSDGTYRLTFSSTCWAALEADSTAPDGNNWVDYVNYTLGWQT